MTDYYLIPQGEELCEVGKLLLSKIQPYTIWESFYIEWCGSISIFNERYGDPIEMLTSQYNKLVRSGNSPFIKKALPVLVERRESPSVGYLYAYSELPRPFDAIDTSFVDNQDFRNSLPKHQAFGLHTYGGYHGCFRPDLLEVVRLLLYTHKWSTEEISTFKRVYVTTQPAPSSNVSKCYDPETDRHRACTTSYIVK